ncbi:MAG: HPr family phosphocarrier protein [Faecousia sp.]
MNVLNVVFTQISQVQEFVNLTIQYPNEVDLVSGRYTVDAKSLLGIYSLDLRKPLQVVIYGENSQQLAEKLKPFLTE